MDVDVPFSELKKRWWPLAGVKDSKLTTPAQRAALLPRLFEFIGLAGGSVGVFDVTPAQIDRVGYSMALEDAHIGAVQLAYADAPFDVLVVDGSRGLPRNHVYRVEQRVAPKADRDYWVVAAASIIAKCHRDAQMLALDDEYAYYDFAHNMGYCGGSKTTSKHVLALREYGLSPHHRRIACRTVLS